MALNAANAEIVFAGDAMPTSRKGKELDLKCRLGPALFDTQLPGLIRGPLCNHIAGANPDGSFLISAGCTLLKADWKFTALVKAPIDSDFPFALALQTLTGIGAKAIAALAGGAVFENWFANGWIEWGAGNLIQRRFITASDAPIAGALTMSLHRYFQGLPALNDVVTVFPGCDGVYTTCKAFNGGSNPTGKFDNYVNFGGEPFTPIANPSATGQSNLNTRGGKK